MKKLLAILLIAFSLCLSGSIFADIPPSTPKLNQQQLLREQEYVKGIFNKIDIYVQSHNWNEIKNYQKECDEIGKIIRNYGYSKDDYGVILYAIDKDMYGLKKGTPMLLKVAIQGKINLWMANWQLKKNSY